MNKENDSIEEYEEEIEEIIEDDSAIGQIKKYGTIVVIVLVVLVIGIFSYNYMNEQSEIKNAEATKHLARVIPLMAQGDYSKALNGDVNIVIENKALMGFKEISSVYSGTDAGRMASFYAGKALLMENNFSEAKSHFENALKVDAEEIKVGAYNGLAACLEEQGDFAGASKNYESAANLVNQTEMKSRYLYFAGLTAEKAGNSDKAKSLYEKVVNHNLENAYSEFGGLSSAGLNRLGTKID